MGVGQIPRFGNGRMGAEKGSAVSEENWRCGKCTAEVWSADHIDVGIPEQQSKKKPTLQPSVRILPGSDGENEAYKPGGRD